MAKLAILDKKGKEHGSIELPDDIFAVPVKTGVMHQAAVMYHTAKRQGNAHTKQRDEISGGGPKPWRQKGTGRARHGSSRSPLWRHGGTTFGPLSKDWSYSIPKKVRTAALRESLNAKFQSKNLTCLEDLKEELSKTKDFATILTALKLNGSILAVLDGCDESIERVSRNINAFAIAVLERQAALGRYVIEMRHNLNNALTSILGNAELLLLESDPRAGQPHSQLETIRNMALRMNEVLQRFSSLEKELNVAARQSGNESSEKAQAAVAW